MEAEAKFLELSDVSDKQMFLVSLSVKEGRKRARLSKIHLQALQQNFK